MKIFMPYQFLFPVNNAIFALHNENCASILHSKYWQYAWWKLAHQHLLTSSSEIKSASVNQGLLVKNN